MQALAAQAVDALEELLADRERPAVRLGAARTLVELAVHRHDSDVLEARLDNLKHRIAERLNKSTSTEVLWMFRSLQR